MILTDFITPALVSSIKTNRRILSEIIVNDEQTTLELYDQGILEARSAWAFPFDVARTIARNVNADIAPQVPLVPVITDETEAGENSFLIQPFSSSIEAEARNIYKQDIALLLIYRGTFGDITAPAFFDEIVNYLIKKTIEVKSDGASWLTPITNVIYNSQVQIDGATSADGFFNSELMEKEQLPETSAIIYCRRFFKK